MNLNRFKRLRQYVSEIEGKIVSASELARLIGVSKSLISGIEKGDLSPSPKVAAKLEEKYGVSREWFLTGECPAPWEEKKHDEIFDELDYFIRQEREGVIEPGTADAFGCLIARRRLKDTPQKKLIDWFVEAGRNEDFRSYLFNVLEGGGGVSLIKEFLEAKKRIKELEKQLEQTTTQYGKHKPEPKKLRMVADIKKQNLEEEK